jgi:hypothetical protein
MKTQCEEIEKLIGAFLDQELSQSEAERVQSHVQGCPVCSKEREELERLQGSLKGLFEARASGLAFEPFWREVHRRISEQKPWYVDLWDGFRLNFHSPRLTWTIPVVIAVLLAVLSLEQFVPGWGLMPHRNNVAAVESIDSHGLNVAVLRESKTKTTVIWLFQSQEGEDESSEEPSSDDDTF